MKRTTAIIIAVKEPPLTAVAATMQGYMTILHTVALRILTEALA
jgi:hypothetical protein